jgi:hypothetical protein
MRRARAVQKTRPQPLSQVTDSTGLVAAVAAFEKQMFFPWGTYLARGTYLAL